MLKHQYGDKCESKPLKLTDSQKPRRNTSEAYTVNLNLQSKTLKPGIKRQSRKHNSKTYLQK